MQAFLGEDFLLTTQTAKRLFHEVAKHQPIIDYHCHLDPKAIWENKPFANVTQLMLGGDHYKWRLMLANGTPEELIRGNGDDYQKFLAFAATLPYAIGNPVYHWTHLELRRVFGIEEVLTPETAPAVWEKANALLKTPDFLPRALIQRFDVRWLCTTDDPADSLEYHKLLAQDKSFPVKVLPTFRPDQALRILRPEFAAYIQRLGKASGEDAATLEGLLRALENRVEYFHQHGGRVSDHALDVPFFAPATQDEVAVIFADALAGKPISAQQADQYQTFIMLALGQMYHKFGWVQQYHIGALRNANTRMFKTYGADVGFDGIIDGAVIQPITALLDALDAQQCLPKTILYNLNPALNGPLAAVTGHFQQSGCPGKVQFGASWWYLDTRDGITEQFKTLGNYGLLGRFVGMLTDSRSFLSYPRHEYFRRLLCQLIGQWVEAGEYPNDPAVLDALVKGICYGNASAYFGVEG